MNPHAVRAVIVVIPVHDEAELLDRCLHALGGAVWAARRRGIRCIVRVVLDACTDASAEVAARHPFRTLHIDDGIVGAARVAGITSALAEVGGLPARRVWIANSDADSAVPANWLTHHIDLAAAGADVVLGTVRPDFADLSPEYREVWLRTHTPGAARGNVHGANLGIRRDVYDAVGGFDRVAEHEDARLVDQCRSLGVRVVASDDVEVLTSGRSIGRTPGGYAAFVRDQEGALASGSEATEPAL